MTQKPLASIRKTSGFSLVEIIFSLGILSFAMVPLFGLLPVGMQVFRDAIDTTVQEQIVQTITSLAEQTDFESLSNNKNGAIPVATKSSSFTELANPSLRAGAVKAAANQYYFFNEDGRRVEQANAVYTAAVTYWVPPESGSTNLPSNTTSCSFATMLIDIYHNRGILVGGVPTGKALTVPLHIANFGKRL